MEQHNNDIYLIGAGGHAKVILALLEELGRKCLGIYDDNEKLWGTTFHNVPVIGALSKLPNREDIHAVIAIGNNNVRRQISEKYTRLHWETLIHPHSWVHKSVKIGAGTVIITGAIVHPDTTIGEHTIINTAATIGHDCCIGSFCHVAPGCHLCGGARVGDDVFIGASTSVIPCIAITTGTVIGAGSAVVRDITTKGTYVGVPTSKLHEMADK